MKKLHCVICSKNKKFEKPKISHLLEKTLALSIICTSVKMKEKNRWIINWSIKNCWFN